MTGLSPFCRERIELWGILIWDNKVLLNELQMKKNRTDASSIKRKSDGIVVNRV